MCAYRLDLEAEAYPEPYEPLNRLEYIPDPAEGLTGLVDGKKASDIEERFARSLSKFEIPYEFQISYLMPHNMVGEYRLDFLVYYGGLEYPYAIDGEYAHKTASQKRADAFKDDVFNSLKQGYLQPVTRVDFTKLSTQEIADDYVKEHILWQK